MRRKLRIARKLHELEEEIQIAAHQVEDALYTVYLSNFIMSSLVGRVRVAQNTN